VGHQETADERSHKSYDHIHEEAEPRTLHDLARQPTRNDADNNPPQPTMHEASSLKVVFPATSIPTMLKKLSSLLTGSN
jgi:hypothetical protein